MTAGLSGIGRLTEAQPFPAPVFCILVMIRAKEPEEGIADPTPGSTASITNVAPELPRAFDTETVKFGFPTNGGEIAFICGVAAPEPARPVPVICGTREDSIYSAGRSNGGSSAATRGSVKGRFRKVTRSACCCAFRFRGWICGALFGPLK